MPYTAPTIPDINIFLLFEKASSIISVPRNILWTKIIDDPIENGIQTSYSPKSKKLVINIDLIHSSIFSVLKVLTVIKYSNTLIR